MYRLATMPMHSVRDRRADR